MKRLNLKIRRSDRELFGSHDDSQVNNGWVIYDLRPLQGGRVMYYAEDERISIFKHNRIIKFVRYQGEYNIGDSIKIVKVK